jgi:hypothetical protein
VRRLRRPPVRRGAAQRARVPLTGACAVTW